MGGDLVTVGRFLTVPRAELVRGRLLAHGIESVLQNAELATIQSSWQGFDSVQLQVRAKDAAAAVRLIAEWDHEAATRRGPAGERCLSCGAALGPADTRCGACGWTWEVSG